MAGSLFNAAELGAIADALADTSEGLTGSEIGYILSECGMMDVSPDLAKRKRLFNAFVESENSHQDRTRILGFIRKAMKPPRYARQPERYEPLRANVNRALAFVGMHVESDGTLKTSSRARTLPEAERRARELRDDLAVRNVHPDVLRFCRAELVAILFPVAAERPNLSAVTSCASTGVGGQASEAEHGSGAQLQKQEPWQPVHAPLPLRTKPVPRETLPSFLSRLAAVNGVGAADFAVDLGFSIKRFLNLEGDAVRALAGAGGLDDAAVADLLSWTGTGVGDVRIEFRGEVFVSRSAQPADAGPPGLPARGRPGAGADAGRGDGAARRLAAARGQISSSVTLSL